MSNKRVTLTYTVDLDDLEAEVERLYNRALTLLSACVEDATTHMDAPMSLETVECLDELRKNLASVDFMLGDINKIISGYISYQIGQSTETSAPPEAPNLMGDLQDKLNTLQDMMVQNGFPTEEQNLPPQGD